jgi:hypothetical protein
MSTYPDDPAHVGYTEPLFQACVPNPNNDVPTVVPAIDSATGALVNTASGQTIFNNGFQGGQFVTWFDPIGPGGAPDTSFPVSVQVVGSTIFVLAMTQSE